MDAGRTPKRVGVALAVAAGVALVAVSVFKIPLSSVLFLGVVLMCPLLMVGMHAGGHDHGHGSGRLDETDDGAAPRHGGARGRSG